MFNLFSKNLNKKKSIFLVFLFIVIFSVVLPHTIFAQPSQTPGWNDPVHQRAIVNTLYSSADSAYTDPSTTENWKFFQSIVIALGQLIVNGAYKIAALFMVLISYILGVILSKPITTDANFTSAWSSVRDLGNMLIVLGFVVVGIATALRIKEYEAKKLLWPLILVALLINFSGLFCGLIIDASNTITGGLGGGSLGLMPFTVLVEVRDSSREYLNPASTNNPGQFMGSCFLFAVVYLGVAFTFLYLSVILLARYAMLIMLFILSPLAFAFWVYPASKKLWTEWWNHFLKWCFVGVFGSFTLWISTIILEQQAIFSSGGKPELSDLITSCAIVLVFLFVGFKMTAQKTGIASMASGAVMGLATGGVGFAAGAVAKGAVGGAKMLNKATGGRSANLAQGVSNKYGKALEWAGLREEGATATGRGEAMKKAQGRMSSLVSEGNISHVQRIAKGEGMGHNSAERAGATAALLKSKNFDMDDPKQVAGLTHFQNQGGDLSEYSTKDPRLSRYDLSATSKTMAKNPGMSETQAQQKNIDTNYSKLGVNGMRDLSANAMDINFFRNANAKSNETASEHYSAEQRTQQKKFATPGTPEYINQDGLQNTLRASRDPIKIAEADRMRDNVIVANRM